MRYLFFDTETLMSVLTAIRQMEREGIYLNATKQ